jgi:hypothetical protein
MSILQGLPTTRCAQIAPSLRVAARTARGGRSSACALGVGATPQRAKRVGLNPRAHCTPPRSHPRRRGASRGGRGSPESGRGAPVIFRGSDLAGDRGRRSFASDSGRIPNKLGPLLRRRQPTLWDLTPGDAHGSAFEATRLIGSTVASRKRAPAPRCADPCSTLRRAACFVARLDPIDIGPAPCVAHSSRPGHNASRAYR